MTLGELIRDRREMKSWSIRHLAYKTGINRSAIERYETDKLQPKAADLFNIAKTLNISLLEIAETIKYE